MIYATDKRFLVKFQEEYSNLEFTLMEPKFLEKLTEIDFSDTILIENPIQSKDTFIAVKEVWRKYLYRVAPDCKLITFGFSDIRHPNHLDLLDLPKDLIVFVETAYTCEEDWNWDLLEGLELDQQLKIFLDGHGQEGFAGWVSNFHSHFSFAYDGRKHYNKSVTDAMIHVQESPYHEQWNTILYLWHRYVELFDFLPFVHLFKEMANLLADIGAFMQVEENKQNEEWLNNMYLTTGDLTTLIDEVCKYVK